MNKDPTEKTGPESVLSAWMKMSADFWGPVAKMYFDPSGSSKKPPGLKKGQRSRISEQLASFIKGYEVVCSLMGEAEAKEAFFKGINTLPIVIMKMARIGWDGLFQMQKEWIERVGRIGKSTEAYSFDNLDKEAFEVWKNIYEKEFRQFLKIPQFGLTRSYQEKTGQFMDRFFRFQGAMAEFMYLIYLPMEQSSRAMRERVEELTKQGKLPAAWQDYYKMWLKTLEGHYMTLFKSTDFTKVLGRTVDAMEDYLAARQDILDDIFHSLHMPGTRDMDDVYKELRDLKTRVRRLERKGQDQTFGN